MKERKKESNALPEINLGYSSKSTKGWIYYLPPSFLYSEFEEKIATFDSMIPQLNYEDSRNLTRSSPLAVTM